MSIKKKLTKHGNSYALIIDRPILELLGIDGNTVLNISSPDGCSLVISPEQEINRKEKFEQELESINKKYKKTLKRLADK